MYKIIKIAHSQSLLNIERDADFLSNTFKPYIELLQYNTSCCDHNSNIDDDDYVEVDFNSKVCSLPLKKYKTILYNFAELLRKYNNGIGIMPSGSSYILNAFVYNQYGNAYSRAYRIKLYYNQYLPDEYVIIMLDTETAGFKHFPGYRCLFISDYYYVYNRHLIDIILNCYTYSQFNSAVKNSTCLLNDILRIVYEYTVAIIKK